MPDPSKWTEKEANLAIAQLLESTIDLEKVTAQRDSKVAAIELKHHDAINRATAEIEVLEGQLEQYYRSHKPKDATILSLVCGEIGLQVGTTPALAPLNDKWTWKKIESSLKRAFNRKFFHKPKAPAIDKVKVKTELTPEELAKYGMKLETSESFYVELKRLKKAA